MPDQRIKDFVVKKIAAGYEAYIHAGAFGVADYFGEVLSQKWFSAAYSKVGCPKIMYFISNTLGFFGSERVGCGRI